MTHLRTLFLAVPLTIFIVASCSSADESAPNLAGGAGGSAGFAGATSGGRNNAGGEPALGGADGLAGDGAGGGDVGGGPSAGGAHGGAGAPSDGGAGGATDACPTDAPQDNTPCTEPRAFCQWGQTRCVCQNNEQWNCENTDCPEMRPTDGMSCQGIETRACRYGRAICACNLQDEWQCRSCPIRQPEESANCPMLDISCDYLDAVCTCTADGWNCN